MDISQLLMNGFPTLATGDIADAGHTDVKIMDYRIKPLLPSMKVAGPAYTVEIHPTGLLPVEALSEAPPGSVIVINAHSDLTAGHLGGLMVLACQVRGIAGIIIDGAVRDVNDILNMGLPVFATGAMPLKGHSGPALLNQTIQCGGITVQPGDMIFADANGVVTFPLSAAKTIYKQAAFIANTELGFVQALNEGKTLLQIPAFLKLHDITLISKKE